MVGVWKKKRLRIKKTKKNKKRFGLIGVRGAAGALVGWGRSCAGARTGVMCYVIHKADSA
jgi:hypothetical protein